VHLIGEGVDCVLRGGVPERTRRWWRARVAQMPYMDLAANARLPEAPMGVPGDGRPNLVDGHRVVSYFLVGYGALRFRRSTGVATSASRSMGMPSSLSTKARLT